MDIEMLIARIESLKQKFVEQDRVFTELSTKVHNLTNRLNDFVGATDVFEDDFTDEDFGEHYVDRATQTGMYDHDDVN